MTLRGQWDSDLFENAVELVAKRLATFRLGLDAEDPYAFNDGEKFRAGIIVGALWAEGLMTDRINGEITAQETKP